jgi:hypothetical protein
MKRPLIHKMGSRAKHIVNKEVIRDIKRVQGKNRLLYEVAQASIEKPEGTVKEVIYPVAGEQTLHDLVAEYKQGGLYDQRVQTIMRGSYSNHYRRMVPHILKALTFCAANETSKPIIEALELMRKYADKNTAFYPEDEYIPLEGVVKPDQLELIQQGQWINRINYELCALPVLREKLRCKEVFVKGASRSQQRKGCESTSASRSAEASTSPPKMRSGSSFVPLPTLKKPRNKTLLSFVSESDGQHGA